MTSQLRPEKELSAFWLREERKGAGAEKFVQRPRRRKSLAQSVTTGGSQWLEGTIRARWSMTREKAGEDAGPAHTLPVRQRLTLIHKARGKPLKTSGRQLTQSDLHFRKMTLAKDN